jgi:mono/diheme cytochrome c family protein
MKQLGLALMLWSLVGCSYTHRKDGDSSVGTSGNVADCGPVDFATINKKVFRKSCTACHSPESGEDVKGVFLTDYPGIKANIKASVSEVLSNRMPKRGHPVGQDEKDLLVAWVNQGMPETTERPSVDSCRKEEPAIPVVPPVVVDPPVVVTPPVSDTLEPNYDSIRQNIFLKRCDGCHGINDTHVKPPKHKYDTYENIIQYKNLFTPGNEDSKFAQALITGDMPFNEEPLSDEEIAVIVDWIRAGLPETQGGPPAFQPGELEE